MRVSAPVGVAHYHCGIIAAINNVDAIAGMKAHIGVHSKEKIIHTVKVSAANVADALALPHLLHGRETRVYGDQAYRGQWDVIRQRAPKAKVAKNLHRLQVTCALTNLFMVRRRLLTG